MDKKYLGNSNTFSLFSEKELINQKYIHEISLIAEKYNILENENSWKNLIKDYKRNKYILLLNIFILFFYNIIINNWLFN